MTKLNCQQTEQALQELLDERAGEPLPRAVSEHLAQCAQCQSWQSLFHLPRHSTEGPMPSNFASRVVERYRWEQRKQRWFRYGSILALAACLFVGVFSLIELPMKNDHQVLRQRESIQEQRSRELLAILESEFASLQRQANSIQPPNIELPAIITNNWELPGIDDPFSIGRPALRTISNTFQNTIEPLEAPAKAAIQRVKSVIDDPEVRKLMSRFNGRAV